MITTANKTSIPELSPETEFHKDCQTKERSQATEYCDHITVKLRLIHFLSINVVKTQAKLFSGAR